MTIVASDLRRLSLRLELWKSVRARVASLRVVLRRDSGERERGGCVVGGSSLWSLR